MSDLQSRLKYIEEIIGGPPTPPKGPAPMISMEEKHRLDKLEWAVSYLSALLRKHLETGET